MSNANTILIIVGAIVTIIGVISIFYPALTRIIRAPGGERLKSIISIIIGIILLGIGIFVNLPTK